MQFGLTLGKKQFSKNLIIDLIEKITVFSCRLYDFIQILSLSLCMSTGLKTNLLSQYLHFIMGNQTSKFEAPKFATAIFSIPHLLALPQLQQAISQRKLAISIPWHFDELLNRASKPFTVGDMNNFHPLIRTWFFAYNFSR